MSNFADSIELIPSSPKGAALVFHGLSSSPGNVKDISEKLYKENYYVYAPQLSGHNGDFEEFKRIDHRVWLADAREAFKHVKSKELPIVIIGQSFGALLSLYLAGNYPGMIQKCVALACPMKFKSFKREIFLSLLSFLPDQSLNFLGSFKKRYAKAGKELGYGKHSIAAVVRIVKIRDIVKPRLNLIECPTLVGQDLEDYHVHPSSLDILESKILHAKLTKKEFSDAGHRLFHGAKSKVVISEVLKFLTKE